MQFRIFKQVPRILFGQNTLERINELLPSRGEGYYAFIIDKEVITNILPKLLSVTNTNDDFVESFNASDKEPNIAQVDELKDRILRTRGTKPQAIIGIGGGSTMDIAKATSLMFDNEGSASLYQGWDLVKSLGVFKIGIPTLSGSGSEASRTAVFYHKDKKFGINSDYSMFDAIILDSTLMATVPQEQKFFSAMDCYIHSVESISGTMINDLSRAYADRGLELCRRYFEGTGNDDQLMVASYMGGCSIVNSEVGICHALSYGLSLELGYRHGVANCIAFQKLGKYYGSYVDEFCQYLQRFSIKLPQNVVRILDDAGMERMVAMTKRMEKPLTNALGVNWREKFTDSDIRNLYSQM